MDFRKLAIADVIRHPEWGVVSYQPEKVLSDMIRVMDSAGNFHHVFANDCSDDITEAEMLTYWQGMRNGAMNPALDLWHRYFKDGLDPWVTDNHGRDSCYFCVANEPNHAGDCIYMAAKTLLEKMGML